MTTLPVIYKKIRFNTHENVGWGQIHLPEQEFQTTSFWFAYSETEHDSLGVTSEEMGQGLKALANILGHVVPLFVLCDPHDVRAVAMVQSPFTKRPTVYVYDNHPGGVGFSEKIFADSAKVFQAARDILQQCLCSDGCPSCAGPALEIGERGKAIAMGLLDRAVSSAGVAVTPRTQTQETKELSLGC